MGALRVTAALGLATLAGATAGGAGCAISPGAALPYGQAVAVAVAPNGRFIVQTREPATLQFFDRTQLVGVSELFASDSVRDTGHQLFHANAGDFLACASCHPEGDDDGHVWTIAGLGRRRTPALRFGLADTAPFHWSGELHDFDALMDEVFTVRMNGGALSQAHIDALVHWLDALPRPVIGPGRDVAQVERGRALFADAATGCAGCHSGAKFTNNHEEDVGTGGLFQVPSLIGLARRAPYMHDGCAATLTARFTDRACGGTAHGNTAGLSADALADLIAYLESL